MALLQNMTEERRIVVTKLADICGLCIFQKHTLCKQIGCDCKHLAHYQVTSTVR
jgi:hypothetical protein